ncbi:NAD-dependent epimerase/dehydratase family protein [Aurantiacibacter gilvus]|uniref:NAD-dependent epimerase/dehydratase family protein n=1 Tax=Aurantiacibacter gilvus TaxID=3139141 RepID=A0ABU9IGI6_9SPHN
MKVVVTGAGGFVGRHLVELLLARGDEVVGIDTVAAGIPEGATALAGDIAEGDLQESALAGGCDALVHLATVPGGAAEADPAASRRVNIDGMYDLLEGAAKAGECPRVVYASSIAVLGHPLPASGVDDQTPLSPELIYGGHKAMMEVVVAMLSNRKAIDGVTIRLPGILARPKGASGMKSAFMSDLFHALKAGNAFTCPTRPQAMIWAQSVSQCARNFVHAIDCDSSKMPPTRAVTLPAQHIGMGELAAEIARQCGTSADLVTWQPDPPLEAAFGAYPPISTPAAEAAGFADDGTLASLVTSALETLE